MYNVYSEKCYSGLFLSLKFKLFKFYSFISRGKVILYIKKDQIFILLKNKNKKKENILWIKGIFKVVF